MNRENWRPKVGDKVRITGHGSGCMSKSVLFTGTVHRVVEIAPDGFVGVFDNFAGRVFVHHRLCDPVLEDERRGAPRPPIKGGETVQVICQVVAECGYATLQYEQLRLDSPRVRQIERRGPNLGREARKS